MSKYGFWEAARKKNPLVKRNASVSALGRNYRVASVSGTGHVVLRDQIIVHPADINPPVEERLKGKVKHAESADWVIADLMNALQDGSIRKDSRAHILLTDAANTYLMECGYKPEDIQKLWRGEIQLTSS